MIDPEGAVIHGDGEPLSGPDPETCPECGETFDIDPEHLYGFGSATMKMAGHRARKHGVPGAKKVAAQEAAEELKVERRPPGRPPGSGAKPRPDTPPKAAKDGKVTVDQAVHFINQTINPAILRFAPMTGFPAPYLATVVIEDGVEVWPGQTLPMGKMIQFDEMETQVYAWAYVYSQDTWVAEWFEKFGKKALPLLLGVAVAGVTFTHMAKFFAIRKQAMEMFAAAMHAQAAAAEAAASRAAA